MSTFFIITKSFSSVLLLLFLMLFSCNNHAQEPENYSAALPATDALGRELPTHDEVGGVKEDKFVGLFYWTWHMNFHENPPHNVSEILLEKPEAIHNYDDPIWPEHKRNSYFFWGEPLYGYYRNKDEWVLRKHAEMLADAGVDVIFFDSTNGDLTWKESYMELARVFKEAREDGIKTPKIAFMLAFGASEGSYKALHKIYKDLYEPGLYKDLWFYWKGKPLVMAYPENLDIVPGDEEATNLNKEIREFFTFRPGQPVYDKGPQREDHWGWLEIYPQHGFVKNEDGGFEQVTVGVGQNWSKERGLTAMNAPGAFGRSYTHEKGHRKDPEAVNYGYNFQEQWDRALEIDPEFVFITGWNEWVAGRYQSWGGQDNAFPDQFDHENSRDIEPMKGGHGDNYYYQMVSNIRRFKGVPAEPKASSSKKIKIDGRFKEWETVMPEFRAHKGSTLHRDYPGWDGTHYTNNTGRNDIVITKVARDSEFLYFYVETAEPLTSYTDPGWMRLFIDVDRNKETGWEGYDFVVNRVNPNKKAVVERSKEDWDWEKLGEISYAVDGNKLELRISKEMLGIEDTVDIEFKWSDNVQQEGEIMDFLLNGDVAPAGRFNYPYSAN